MSRRYLPALHDEQLAALHSLKHTDQMIADAMGFAKSTVQMQRVRLKLPNNFICRPNMHREPEPALPKPKPNPLALAYQWLGRRLDERNGAFWLDGIPASLETVMRAAYGKMTEQGLKPEIVNERWRP